MTGKDLFDAINNVNDEYLDEVTAEIAQENEQNSAGESGTKATGLRISKVPAWSAVAAVMVILFVIVVALNLRNRKSGDPAKTSANKVTVTVIPTETVTATPTETVTATPVPDEEEKSVRDELLACSRDRLYNKCMNIATPEQKAQLKAILDDLYSGDFGGGKKDYTRRILTIMGVIPEDAPRLTLEDAKRLIEEMRAEGLLDNFPSCINQIRERFNTVAIAPDVDGGSGFGIITYVLDSEKKTYIQIHSGAGIIYYDGTEETKLFGPGDLEIIDHMEDSVISEKYFPNDYTGWRYPVLPRMSTWPYGDVAAMIDACKIPEDVVSAMATSDLIQSVLLYPMLPNAGLYSDLKTGYRQVKSWCNALQELATREDRYEKILTVMDEHSEWFFPTSDKVMELTDSSARSFVSELLILANNEDFSEIQQQIQDKLTEIYKNRSKKD